jgi:stage V sporulation protein AE
MILDNTKLTAGHITSILVVVGAILGMCGLYDRIVDIVGMGATLPITSFGNTLFNSAYEGYLVNGFLGIFNNILCDVSLGISAAIVFSFLFSLPNKVRD